MWVITGEPTVVIGDRDVDRWGWWRCRRCLEVGDFDGARVLITGAASGIGEATARLLAVGGARLALLDRDGVELTRVSEELGAEAIVANVADADAVRSGVESAAAALGGLDHPGEQRGTGSLGRIERYSIETSTG